MKKIGLFALLLALGSFAIAGCGGDDESDAPTKAEYITQADEICQRGDDDLEVVIEETFGDQNPSQEQIVQFTEDEVIPNIESQLEDLRALTPPEGEEENVAAIYDALEQGLEELKQDPGTQDQPESIAEANRLAEEFGFEVCGNET
jgi:hypothetical protein